MRFGTGVVRSDHKISKGEQITISRDRSISQNF